MIKRIEKDYKHFRDVISGKTGKHLKHLTDTGELFRKRPDGRGFMPVTIPKINTPRFVHGEQNDGLGRGDGEIGKIIDKDKKGQGKGNKAGKGHKEGMEVHVDMEWVLQFLGEDLKLPRIKPKTTETWEELRYKYNNISRVGPRSLRHMRKSLLQALKRNMAGGELEPVRIPGVEVPIKVINFINDDFRYRQYNEIKIPSSNAVIFFARDSSGSMSEEKCNIVSDMAWWIDVWIRSFYKRTERVYVCHDTEAMEVDEDKFYRYRYGGGTYCSSALKLISKQFKDRFPPHKWNIYVFYFSDGDNWGEDDIEFVRVLKEKFPPEIVNFVGMCQILSYNYENSVKHSLDSLIENNVFPKDFLRTASIGEGKHGGLPDDERNQQTKEAIRALLGAKEKSVIQTIAEGLGGGL